jgi:hypothetical protein
MLGWRRRKTVKTVQKIDFTHQRQNIETLYIHQFADAMG